MRNFVEVRKLCLLDLLREAQHWFVVWKP